MKAQASLYTYVVITPLEVKARVQTDLLPTVTETAPALNPFDAGDQKNHYTSVSSQPMERKGQLTR